MERKITTLQLKESKYPTIGRGSAREKYYVLELDRDPNSQIEDLYIGANFELAYINAEQSIQPTSFFKSHGNATIVDTPDKVTTIV